MTRYISLFPNNDRSYLKNAIFNAKNNNGREVPIFIKLKKFLKKRDIDINTFDIYKGDPYKYIYIDLPYPTLTNIPVWKTIFINRKKNILICVEPPMVFPLNYMKFFHLFFTKIYTWNDQLVDNEKYFKILLPKSSFKKGIRPRKFKGKKFLVLINSNKSLFYPFKLLSGFGRELYSERIKAIEFFEHHIPDRFFLYGVGWNKPKRYNIKESILGFKKYKTYKRTIDNKLDLLSGFKYCLCFENLTDTKGFVTEKIFDCFKAGCVPIYWGASDIEKYIPKNCFIDFRNFKDLNELILFLDLVQETTYNRYIKNIKKLLSNKKFINTWFEEGFAHFFLENILEFRDNDK